MPKSAPCSTPRLVVVFCVQLALLSSASAASADGALLSAPAVAAADPCVCDIDHDHVVSLSDIGLFADDFYSGKNPSRSDFNRDGFVNLIDLVLLAQAMMTSGCP